MFADEPGGTQVHPNRVVPAQAGTHNTAAYGTALWIPACAGVTAVVFNLFLSVLIRG
jgi:hypothetical protein